MFHRNSQKHFFTCLFYFNTKYVFLQIWSNYHWNIYRESVFIIYTHLNDLALISTMSTATVNSRNMFPSDWSYKKNYKESIFKKIQKRYSSFLTPFWNSSQNNAQQEESLAPNTAYVRAYVHKRVNKTIKRARRSKNSSNSFFH